MAFKEVQSLDTENAISLGGYNKKTKKENPTSAVGYYLGSRTITTKMGEAQLHVLSTPKGNLGVYGKTDLDRKIKQVTPGAMIRITQSGSRPTNKGNDLMLFKVEVDEDDSMEVSPAPSVSSSNDAEEEVNSEFSDYTGEDEDDAFDEAPPARPTRPAQAAASPNAARQAQVKDLLNKSRSKSQ